MARYRIGNDITILWAVNDRDGRALPLSGKDVHLYYICERGRFEADIEIQDVNVVAWNFLGSKQRTLGNYTLTLEVLQSNGKRVIRRDVCNAFTLVGKSCEERYDKDDGEINEGGEITLVSELDIYRISPIVPYIEKKDGVEYWFVDGVNTGKPARGEKGDVVDASYMVFDVDENMDLNLTFLSTNDQLELDFNIDENGYLTVDK